jgi:Ca2+-binding RTX toxin-like protein
VTFISPSDVGSFDYHIIGTTSEDEIYGGSGTDLIEGGDGHNYIWAREGDDEIHAGAHGSDIEAGTGNDLIFGSDGEGTDAINGYEGNDDIFAGAGQDRIFGGPGTDWLEGGDGHDWLYFSLGSFNASLGQYEVDHYDGNMGHDVLRFTNFQGAFENYQEVAESVIVDMNSNSYEAIVKDQSGTLVTVNGEFFNIQSIGGSYGDDVLLGDDADNHLSGGDGNNIIYGYGGNDGLGAAYFGNNIFYGGSGNDQIGASAGNNILYGEAGDDLLRVDGNEDELHGGEGCDGFIFSTNFGTHTIMDFDYPYDQPACDLIHIAIHSSYRVDFGNVKINTEGPNDIIIDVEVKRGGRWSGTIILKDALLNGVTVDESTFVFPGEYYPDVDCSRYYCDPNS